MFTKIYMKKIKEVWNRVEKVAETYPFAASIAVTITGWLLLIFILLYRLS